METRHYHMDATLLLTIMYANGNKTVSHDATLLLTIMYANGNKTVSYDATLLLTIMYANGNKTITWCHFTTYNYVRQWKQDYHMYATLLLTIMYANVCNDFKSSTISVYMW